MSFSRPQRCPKHIDDIVDWQRETKKHIKRLCATVKPELSASQWRHWRPDVVSALMDEYKGALLIANPIAREMFYRHENRRTAKSGRILKKAFRLPPDVELFIILAAASGIIGNLSYDVLKKIVLSFLKKLRRTQPQNAESGLQLLESSSLRTDYTRKQKSIEHEGKPDSKKNVTRLIDQVFSTMYDQEKPPRKRAKAKLKPANKAVNRSRRKRRT